VTGELNDCVLVVEDEFIIAHGYVITLEAMGLTVCGVVDTAAKALELATLHRPRLVLMDNRLKGGDDGVSAAIAIHADVGSRLIFITGSGDPQTVARIDEDHATAVLFKPVHSGQLRKTVASALSAA
jgi:two-component system, response regulator PdtaR